MPSRNMISPIGPLLGLWVLSSLLVTKVALAEEVGYDLIRQEVARELDDEVRARLDWCEGLSFGVVYGSRLVYTAAYGSHDLGHVQQWGSVSKPVTAMIAHHLVEAGALDLYTPVWELDPSYDDLVPQWHRVVPLSLYYLLHHHGGVTHHADARTSEMFIEVPGTVYIYSTNSYGIVGDVLTATQGVPYPDLVDRYVAERFGLHLWTFEDWWSPAAFVTSAFDELCLFGVAVMRHGFIDEETLYDEVLQDYGSTRGLGWIVTDVDGDIRMDHGGSNGTPQTHLRMRPRRGLGLALFCTARETRDLYFDETLDRVEGVLERSGSPCRIDDDCLFGARAGEGSELPVGAWSLDDAARPGADGSGRDNDLELFGSIRIDQGRVGMAARFDGAAPGLLRDSDETPREGLALGSSFTVAAWIRLTDIGRDMTLVSRLEDRAREGGYRLKIRSDGRIELTVSPGERPNALVSPDPLDPDGWVHVAGTYDAGIGQMRIMVDGRLVASHNVIFDEVTPSAGRFLVGGSLSEGLLVSEPFDGLLDEVRVYDRALSIEEVRALPGFVPGSWGEDAGPPAASWTTAGGGGCSAAGERASLRPMLLMVCLAGFVARRLRR